MSFLLVVVLFHIVLCLDLDEPVINVEIIHEINSDPSSGWTAGVNPVFVGKTYRDIKHLFYDRPIFEDSSTSSRKSTYKSSKEEMTVPDYYDVYDQLPSCKTGIQSQGQCGDDYAFAATQALTDRFCVALNGTKGTEMLSAQDIVSCWEKGGCQGLSSFSGIFDYLKDTGIVTEKCYPYKSGGSTVPKCPYNCVDGEDWNESKHKFKSWRKLSNVEDAQQDTMQYGSFWVIVNGYQDFMQYQGGVYYHQSGGMVGSHSMKVQGWGVDSKSGLPYWNCELAWTESFGINGYMWFLRGHNECGFEDYMYSGIPEI